MSDADDMALALAEQVLDDGYPFPEAHPWWAEQARTLAKHVQSLAAENERLRLADSNWGERP